MPGRKRYMEPLRRADLCRPPLLRALRDVLTFRRPTKRPPVGLRQHSGGHVCVLVHHQAPPGTWMCAARRLSDAVTVSGVWRDARQREHAERPSSGVNLPTGLSPRPAAPLTYATALIIYMRMDL